MKNTFKTLLILITIIVISLSCTPKYKGQIGLPENLLEVNKTGYPIVDEPVSFDVAVVVDHIPREEDMNYLLFDEISERTNVSINWEMIPNDSKVAKLILKLASNTYPEAFYGIWADPSDWQRLSDQGFIIPLSPYIDEGWMPRLKSILDSNVKMFDYITMDGVIYSLPSHGVDKNEKALISHIMLNNEWMKALDLELPETIDDFYEVLKAFRDGDPNGNGKNDEIPLSASKHHDNTLNHLFGSFGIDDYFWHHRALKNGKIVMTGTIPEYRDAIEYFNTLYQEKLLDMEYFSQEKSQLASKIRNNQVGAWIGWISAEYFGLDPNDRDAIEDRILVIPPLKGRNGEALWHANQRSVPGQFEITNKCKSPEALLRWADELYEAEASLQILHGPYGLGLEKTENGTIRKIPQDWIDFEKITFPNGPRFIQSPGIADTIEKSATDAISDDIYQMYEPYLSKETYPSLSYGKAENRKLSSLIADIHKLYDNKQVSWITGKSDINKEWDKYLVDMEKMGIEEMRMIYQTAYDKYLERIKTYE